MEQETLTAEGYVKELEARLREAEETLDAIRAGRVDALVMSRPDGDAVYTLQSADYPYRVIVEQMSEGAVTLAEDGTILYGNHRLTQMLGRSVSSMIGKAFYSFVTLDDREAFGQLMLDPHQKRREMGLLANDGSKIPVHISAGQLELEGQSLICLVVTDLTGQKRLEEQLRQSQKMEAIGTLAGGIAHDFNNILAIIMGNAEIAIDDAGEGRKNIERILKASKRARELIRQILTFSRKSSTDKKPISLGNVLRETYTLLRSSTPVTIDLRLDVRTEADTIKADPGQIEQVVMNLVMNAVQAMPDGEGVVTIHLSDVAFRPDDHMPDEDMEPGNYAKLTIADTGTGMTDDVKRRVFEPFFTTKAPGKGTGMGLAVIYGIVKDHDGSVMVESAPGKGANFTIFLPLLKVKPEEEEEGQAAVIGGKERILVVDDEENVVEMLFGTLTRIGYRVECASSGMEALDMIRKDGNGYDLILTDQTMPDITGLQLASELRKTKPNLPVVLSTGYSQAVDAESVARAGISAAVMKPLERGELARVIRRVLDQKRPST